MIKTFTLPAFAKINLSLKVLGKRPDGYHELSTFFQTISLCDYLTFGENDELKLTCNQENVPLGESNLIYKAAVALQKKFQITNGAKIHLEKNIPFPGGLGGGSADAAVALLGLAKLWNLNPTFAQLKELAIGLGADVPFFLYGGTAYASGRGEILKNIRNKDSLQLILATPPIEIETPKAFKSLNAPDLTNLQSKSILKLCHIEAENFDWRHQILENDFENIIFQSHPEIKRVKEKMLELGAVKALMTGSGASVFGIFDNQQKRQEAFQLISEEKNWKVFLTETVSFDEYRKKLKIVANLLC